MTPSPGASPRAPAGEQLLALALAQPREALIQAQAVVSDSRRGADAHGRSVAYQAMGIVRRDEGQHAAALEHFAAARRWARRAADSNRLADVEASEGVALVQSGKTRIGLARLERAASRAEGITAVKVHYRRAAILIQLGRYDQAKRELLTVARQLRGADEPLWVARTHLSRSWVDSATGRVAQAEREARTAHDMFLAHGQIFEAAIATENLGWILAAAGRIPQALAVLDQAEAAFANVGAVPTELAVDRCATLLLARLVPEAGRLAQRVAGDLATPAHVRAEMQLLAAECALDEGATQVALDRALAAQRMFRAQRREDWQWRAELVGLRARMRAGQVTRAERRRVEKTVAALAAASSPSTRLAHLVAAELYSGWNDQPAADRHLRLAAEKSRRATAFDRALASTAGALRAEYAGSRAAVFAACRAGLQALDDQRSYCADPELRAVATDHARALTDLALRTALATGRPWTLVQWSERTRAVALAPPPVRPPSDPRVASSLAAAREATRRAAEASDPQVAAYLVRQAGEHETLARRVARHSTSRGIADRQDLRLRPLVDSIGDGALLVLIEVSGTLHRVLVQGGRVHRQTVGPLETAVREAEFARFALRRAAFRGREIPARVPEQLQSCVLGPTTDRLPGRVVVIPPAPLHTVPWSLMPALMTREVSVAPSARLWLRATRRQAAPEGQVVLVTGPGLSSGQREAGDVARLYQAPIVLGGAAATTSATLAAINGAAVANVAAHGSFRGDAPMFSALRLADGPLYMHDLDALEQPPHTLILSACDAGDTASVGLDEGLGLVTSLLGMGTAQVLASVVPVNDEATIPVMRTLHRSLAAGAGLAMAARLAREAHRGDPERCAAAASFTAWGA